MTKFLVCFFISSLTFTASSQVISGEIPSIEVTGQASLLVEPDFFSSTIAIVERGQFTNKIRSVVNHKSNQVVQLAQRLGIKKHNINSAKVTLNIVRDKPSISIDSKALNQQFNSQNKVKPQYFELRRTITVNFTRIEDYDQFLNKIINLGVGHISPLALSVKNSEKHYQQALTQSFNNAHNKAQKIANNANVKLGKLLFVKEQSSNYYRARVSSSMMSAERGLNHQSQVGVQAINASVLVKYSIQE